MKRLSVFCCVVALSCACAGVAQDFRPAVADGGAKVQGGGHVRTVGVELLSDTQGVNFQPYMKLLFSKINGQGMPLLPAAARLNPGETVIRFTIRPDGTIAAMHLDGSADELLDRAAWGAITGRGKFPALPKEFHGPDLELRIHFAVNP